MCLKKLAPVLVINLCFSAAFASYVAAEHFYDLKSEFAKIVERLDILELENVLQRQKIEYLQKENTILHVKVTDQTKENNVQDMRIKELEMRVKTNARENHGFIHLDGLLKSSSEKLDVGEHGEYNMNKGHTAVDLDISMIREIHHQKENTTENGVADHQTFSKTYIWFRQECSYTTRFQDDSKVEQSANSTSSSDKMYDSRGAVTYMVAVLLTYAVAVVGVFALSFIRRRKSYTEMADKEAQLFIKNIDHVRSMSEKKFRVGAVAALLEQLHSNSKPSKAMLQGASFLNNFALVTMSMADIEEERGCNEIHKETNTAVDMDTINKKELIIKQQNVSDTMRNVDDTISKVTKSDTKDNYGDISDQNLDTTDSSKDTQSNMSGCVSSDIGDVATSEICLTDTDPSIADDSFLSDSTDEFFDVMDDY